MFISVFTPTYNRADKISRVYHSLLSQNLLDFEWIVVDDGSTDETMQLVLSWIAEGKIKIIYYYQPNSGKHVAYNYAVNIATGIFFTVLDSDDACDKQALKDFYDTWNSIPSSMQNQFSGISCFCIDQFGNKLGKSKFGDFVDGYQADIYRKYNLKYEMWGMHKTQILKKYPYPVYPNEKFIAESTVWDKISKVYKTRLVNKYLRIYFIEHQGLSSNSIKNRINSINSTLNSYSVKYEYSSSFLVKSRALINYYRFWLHGNGLIQTPINSAKRYHKLFCSIVGFFLYIRDKILIDLR